MRIKEELYPHSYEPIITRELFEQVKSVREGYKVRPHRWGGLPFVYRGLITCGECGCRITFETKKGKYVYGHCTQSREKHSFKYISEHVITDQVVAIVKSIQIPQDAYEEVSTAMRVAHEDKKKIRAHFLSSVEIEILKYQNRMDKVYEDYLDEKITEDLYKRKSDEYCEKQKNHQYQRDNIELVDDQYFATVSHLLKLAKDAPTHFENAKIEEKREILKTLLSNFTLNGNQLRWEYKKPFDTMAFCTKNSDWLPTIEAVITAIKQDLAVV